MRMFESNQKVLQMQSDRMSREISDLGSPADMNSQHQPSPSTPAAEPPRRPV